MLYIRTYSEHPPGHGEDDDEPRLTHSLFCAFKIDTDNDLVDLTQTQALGILEHFVDFG